MTEHFKVDVYVDLFCNCDYRGWVVILRLTRRPPTWKMAVHMAAADDVFVDDQFYIVISHMMPGLVYFNHFCILKKNYSFA